MGSRLRPSGPTQHTGVGLGATIRCKLVHCTMHTTRSRGRCPPLFHRTIIGSSASMGKAIDSSHQIGDLKVNTRELLKLIPPTVKPT